MSARGDRVPFLGSLAAQVVLLVLSIALPCTAVIAYLAHMGAKHAQEQAMARVKHVAEEIASDAATFIRSTEARATFLARVPRIRAPQRAQCDPLIQATHLMNPRYSMVFQVDSAGDVVCWSLDKDPAGVNYGDRAWFSQAMRATGFLVGAPLAGRVLGGTLAIPMTLTVRDANGAVSTILNLAATMREVSRLAEHPGLPEGSVATIVSADGTIVARSLEPEKWLGKDVQESPFIASLVAKREGTVVTRGLDDVERIYAFTTIPGVGWLVAAAVPVEVVVGPYRERLVRTGLLVAIVTAGVVILALLLARRILQPVQALAASARSVTSGVFGPPVPESGPHEIREVTRTFNRMKRARLDAERQLKRSTLELRSANAELEAFAYSVSHDLRTPLRAISGFSQVLVEDYRDRLDDEGKDSLLRIQSATQRLSALIDDILKLSRATRSALAPQEVDLSRLVEAALAELRAAEPGRAVSAAVMPGIAAWGDPGLLAQVIANLVGNAWKFTSRRQGARIEFFAERAAAELRCCVRDNGAGFDPEYKANLFGPFQRLHSDSEFPGTGIGLATVKRIITRHGGRIWAEGAVNQGAAFYFTLPGKERKGEPHEQ